VTHKWRYNADCLCWGTLRPLSPQSVPRVVTPTNAASPGKFQPDGMETRARPAAEAARAAHPFGIAGRCSAQPKRFSADTTTLFAAAHCSGARVPFSRRRVPDQAADRLLSANVAGFRRPPGLHEAVPKAKRITQRHQGWTMPASWLWWCQFPEASDWMSQQSQHERFHDASALKKPLLWAGSPPVSA
jgi:hypothetical protein